MKKKFLILSLCFTIIFTSINYKKSYAFDGGVVSVPMAATILTLATASGVIINNSDDLYDICNVFYNNYRDNWDYVQDVFNTCVSIGLNGVVSVGKDFAQMVTSSLDSIFLGSTSDINLINGLPLYPNYIKLSLPTSEHTEDNPLTYGTGIMAKSIYGSEGFVRINSYSRNDSSNPYAVSVMIGQDGGTRFLGNLATSVKVSLDIWDSSSGRYCLNINGMKYSAPIFTTSDYRYSLPYSPSYDSSNLKDKESYDIYVPGSLDSLVGGNLGYNDVLHNGIFDPPYDLPIGGVVSIPGVSDPTIDVDDSISFPTVGDVPDVDVPDVDVPVDTPFANITEYIIGLVVPADSYWTDTFGGLYNNFTSSFPMVDMDNFNNLVTGEKKFPNIDINIMGVTGRVVNGDVVNSIVEWLRPIIAGFMMLCLMLFNYRKIYKTIRGVEPFQGIAQGTSDFRTGISEYNYMGTGLSKSDYEANEMELAKALHDHYQDTGKTYKVRI